jgi:hypothetical protein
MWFDVDRTGLAKLLERRGKEFIFLELVSNALDTEAGSIIVRIAPVPGRPLVRVEVEDDDPDGFKNLAHAWTLFAESIRKGDPAKRGRFNLGEKLVLAIMEEASIETTTGSVRFDSEGRHQGRKKRAAGSVFSGLLKMTRDEIEKAERLVRGILVPPERILVVNDARVPSRVPLREFELLLPTEVATADGALRRSYRKTKVATYEPLPGQAPTLHELGIPVVEMLDGDPYHIDVSQKVPLNMDRDNVSPAYLRELRVAVLNQMHDRLEKAQAEAPWARVATSDDRCSDDAARTVAELRFGKKAVAFDLSDPEGTKLAVSKGYTVVPGGALSGEEWSIMRRAGALPPAGKVTPSPKPYSDDPDAPPVKVLDPVGLQVPVVKHIERLASLLLHRSGVEVSPKVRIVHTTNGFSAAYGPGGPLDLNIRALGKRWFVAIAEGERDELHELLIHELAHQFERDHLSEGFHRACCKLGARLAELALEDPLALRISVPEETGR